MAKLYIHSMTLIDDETGEERETSLEEMEEEEERSKVFVCAGCGKVTSWSEGAADDMPDHCDSCWCKEHRPETTHPISSEITYV